jgi:polyphenol oxidase
MILRSEALSALPALDHGFFTRRGGVSDGAWASLNVGLRAGDAPERVTENRARAAGALGGTAERLVTARQVHGAVALAVAEPWDNHAAPEADALVTDRPGLILGVLTADCGPVLLADREAGVVGAVHAGWKGALGGVLEAALAAMARLGATPGRVAAALGPCIAQSSYEVGPEFVARFAAKDNTSGRFFVPLGLVGKARFDLAGYVAARLRRAGVAQVDVLGHDTCAEEELFFSFRRTTQRREERFGLQLSAISLRE